MAKYKPTSQYSKTLTKDFYLDIYNPVPVAETIDDPVYEIEPKYHQRPDLLAYELYGTPNYWWVFAVRNMDTLIDPINDFNSGTLIYIPLVESIGKSS